MCQIFSQNNKIAKKLYKTERSKILKTVMEKKFNYPLTYDTVLHLLNHIEVKNKELANMEDSLLRSDMDLLFGTI